MTAITLATDQVQAAETAEFARGWRVVVASMVGISLGLSPMPMYTIGVFAPYLAGEFGWSMSEIMFGITVTTLALLAAGPLAGWLSQIYGVRRVVLVSQFTFALSFMALGLSTGSLALFYANFIIMTMAGAGTLPITFSNTVNRWFEKRRGLALGISLMGTGIFGILCKPLLAWMIPEFGWRGSYFGLGLLPLLIALPVSYFFLTDSAPEGEQVAARTTPGGMTLAQTVRDWRFWILALAILPISVVLSGPIPNMENMLVVANIDAATIVALTPMIGLSAMIGRIAGGWLIDHFWAPAVGFVILALPAISCLTFAYGDMSPGVAAMAIFLIGFALGIEYDLLAYFVSRYFGMKSYGSIYSFLYIFFAVGAGLGPVVMGADFDAHGDYSRTLFYGSFVLIACAASFLLLGKYRDFAPEKAA